MTESVWDYPRPPRIEPSSRRVRVVLGGETIADTTEALRVLETSHPPSWYLPPDAFLPGAIQPGSHEFVCEFKGVAYALTLVGGGLTVPDAAWTYPRPMPGYDLLGGSGFNTGLGLVAVYASRVDACFVDDEQVVAQEGDFYGGWITSDVGGPFKGPPGTESW